MDNILSSVRKKRKVIEDDDERIMTPKKARISHATPSKSKPMTLPASVRKINASEVAASPGSASHLAETLPEDLAHLYHAHTALEHALTVALATAQISPDPDTGRVPAVLNHLSVQQKGLGVRLDIDDLKRLCWLWEWDGQTFPKALEAGLGGGDGPSTLVTEVIRDDDISNPFLMKSEPAGTKDWMRGGMGFVISPATHVQKSDTLGGTGSGKRVPSYGIGIEVDWSQEDVVSGRVGGMGAVARWTSRGESRKKTIRNKLDHWNEVTTQSGSKSLPVPMADLPALPKPTNMSFLNNLIIGGTPRKPTLSSRNPSPPKGLLGASPMLKGEKLVFPILPQKDADGFKVPFPVTPSGNHSSAVSTPISGSSSIGPQTPSHRSGGIRTPSFGRAAAPRLAANTPSSAGSTPTNGRVTPTSRPPSSSATQTPIHQMAGSKDLQETPISARRMALYERIRAKSESEDGSAKKVAVTATVRAMQTPKKITKLVGPEELRRRCILGRLGTIAEVVWMLFASKGSTSATRKRKAMEKNEVVIAIVKSANVPISDAEAVESLAMLCELCPFFLRSKFIGGEEWLEMPASTGIVLPASPGKASKDDDDYPLFLNPGEMSPSRSRATEEALLNRSPKRVRREDGGLRQVREVVRKELEVDDDDF